MAEPKRTRQLIVINQAQRRGKGCDATPFFFVVRTLVLERFSAVLIPPVFPPNLTPMLAGWHDGCPRACDIPPAFSGLIFGSRARASRSSTVGAARAAPPQ